MTEMMKMPALPRPMREMVVRLLATSNGYGTQVRYVMTASQIGYWLRVKLSSLSSLLNKLTREGILLKVKGFGSRGGYGYMMNPNASRVSLTPWDATQD